MVWFLILCPSPVVLLLLAKARMVVLTPHTLENADSID